jgi:PQQ-dependent catabolism-associated CXXCW motif protein
MAQAAGAAEAAAAQPAAATAAEPDGYWTGDVDAPVPATISGGSVIHAKELQALLRQPGAAIIDVSNAPRRPSGLAPGAPWLPLPHRALPGALWIPGAGAGTISPEMDKFFHARLTTATDDLDAPLVVYCHDRCWLSWNAAKRAIGYGYRRVYWFSDGIEGWTASGGPTVTAEPQVHGESPTSDTPVKTDTPARAKTDTLALSDSKLPQLVVLDLELTGDLGGPDFAAEHEARLKKESARLRQALERTGMYQILDASAAADLINRLKSHQLYLHDCNGCDLEVGRELHADLVLVAWVDRVSGLILTLTYEIHDVNSSQITARKSFDFRGDNDAAWNHAIDFMVRDLQATRGLPASQMRGAPASN